MKMLIIFLFLIISLSLLAQSAQARGRYGSTRVGGINSSGKGSHYIGGYVRTCHGWACR